MEDSGYYSERQKQEQMSVNEERQVNADKLRVGGMCYNEPSPSPSIARTATCGRTGEQVGTGSKDGRNGGKLKDRRVRRETGGS